MNYNFDESVKRQDTGCLKWDLFNSDLPMWVADMDFKAAPEIIQALKSKISTGIYGYSIITEDWFEAYINWWKNRHDIKIKKENLLFAPGVVPALSSIIRTLTNTEDKILIQPPVYHVFFNIIKKNNRQIALNSLIYNNYSYKIDFDDLDAKLADEKTTLMILCNPHNPIGKIWSQEDLKKIIELCNKHDVILISDEIHGDLVNPGLEYNSVLKLNDVDNLIVATSPSKAFNLAGFQSASLIIPSNSLKEKIKIGLARDELSFPNLLAINSTVTAYNKCAYWLDSLNEYLYENKKFVDSYLKKNIPQLMLVNSQATYLLWIDGGEIIDNSDDFVQFLSKNTGLLLSPGSEFGENGEGFLRMNIACSKEMVEKGLDKLKEGIELYKS